MLSSGKRLSLLIAVAALAAASSGTALQGAPTGIRTGRVRPKFKSYVPKMQTASEQEIAEWNRKVEEKKAAKKLGASK